MRANFEVIDFKILPKTEELYKTSSSFKKLVDAVKKAQRERDDFINKYNKCY